MTKDAGRDHLTMAVIGAGAMGRGIAQLFATAGVDVMLYDTKPETVEEGLDFVRSKLERQVDKGRMERGAADAAMARLTPLDELTGCTACDVVVEAVIEDIEVKRKVFASLDAATRADCILATNTSSLSVTDVAAVCKDPSRVAGLHFFNPVPLMRLVEVVDGVRTAPETTAFLMELVRRAGHQPVRVADSPGFLVNHAGRGYGTEALRILGERIAPVADVDRVLVDACGFRMGPFALFDLTGLDVSHPVMESIYHQFYQEPRFRPSPITRQRLAAGLVGRKAGEGFYDHADGGGPGEEPPAPDARPETVWLSEACPDGAAALRRVLDTLGVTPEDGARPSANALCLVTPHGADATTTAVDQDLPAQRTVAVDTLFGLNTRRTIMGTPATERAALKAAHGLLSADGTPVTVIGDSPGFIAQRVLATIVNIACDIAQAAIATPEDIDRAVTLGLGYPHGPLAWGDAIGPQKFVDVLDSLHRFYGDPRYRASPWLRRRAALGMSLTQVGT